MLALFAIALLVIGADAGIVTYASCQAACSSICVAGACYTTAGGAGMCYATWTSCYAACQSGCALFGVPLTP